MINIILLDTKQSERMPGKNALLWEYTTNYLEHDETANAKGTRVIVVYTKETSDSIEKWPWKCDILSAKVGVGELNTTKECIDYLYNNFYISDEDVNVLLQLTQPVRRNNLIVDSIKELDNCELVKSYCTWYDSEWRNLEHEENIKQHDKKCRYYDGAIYTWKGKLEWLNGEKIDTHYIENYTGPVVDIDYADQYNKEYINGVQKLADQ